MSWSFNQSLSDRAMPIFSAIHPNLAYSPDADPRRDRNAKVTFMSGNLRGAWRAPIKSTTPIH
ncbi:MAG: hypothetical protein RLP02_20920 [Coleofasciculus sp. C2-GNP5-27]